MSDKINFNVKFTPTQPLEFVNLSFTPEDFGCETIEEVAQLLNEVIKEMKEKGEL
jgi:hypothetical protein